MTLKPASCEGFDGTLGGESTVPCMAENSFGSHSAPIGFIQNDSFELKQNLNEEKRTSQNLHN